MESFNQIVLILHVAAGFFGLLVGLVPMFAQKGSKLHVLAGLAFYYAMLFVCISATWLVFFKPSALFLLFIAMFSFYMAFVGKRAFLIQKNKQAFLLDKFMALAAMLAGIWMVVLGGKGFYQHGAGFQQILFVVFGTFFGYTGFEDLKLYWKAEKPVKQGVLQHISRMMGGYIAFVTAFATVNSRYIPHDSQWVDLAAWILPGVLGGIMINRFTQKFNKKPLRTTLT